jgi:hypothetical protein
MHFTDLFHAAYLFFNVYTIALGGATASIVVARMKELFGPIFTLAGVNAAKLAASKDDWYMLVHATFFFVAIFRVRAAMGSGGARAFAW